MKKQLKLEAKPDYSRDRNREIFRLWKECGLTTEALAIRFGMSKKEIAAILAKEPLLQGLPRNLEIIRLRRECGMTLDAIGTIFGITRQSVRNVLNKETAIQKQAKHRAALAEKLNGRPRSVLWTKTHDWTPQKQELEIRQERKEILSKAEQISKQKMHLE